VGRDDDEYDTVAVCVSFNPRARVGRDAQAFGVPYSLISVSIHAPAWGATVTEWVNAYAQDVSIHAPAWGATDIYRNDLINDDVSIHAPAWGAT